MFKDFFKGGEKDKFRWPATAIALIVGLVFLIGGSPFSGGGSSTQPPSPTQMMPAQDNSKENLGSSSSQPNMVSEEQYLANKLRDMLELVDGVGSVQVTVRLESSSRAEYAINTTTGTKTTQEKDQAGGTRVLTEDNDSGQLVLIRIGNGTEIPVLQQETAPNVSGVLVVADGASDPAVKAELFRAVQVGLGVEPQKIMIMAKSK